MAKKKTVKGKEVVAKVMPVEACSTNRCCSSMLLCKLSIVAAVFFLISVFPTLGTWAMNDVHWGIWLIVAIVLGWKPMMKHCGKS